MVRWPATYRELLEAKLADCLPLTVSLVEKCRRSLTLFLQTISTKNKKLLQTPSSSEPFKPAGHPWREEEASTVAARYAKRLSPTLSLLLYCVCVMAPFLTPFSLQAKRKLEMDSPAINSRSRRRRLSTCSSEDQRKSSWSDQLYRLWHFISLPPSPPPPPSRIALWRARQTGDVARHSHAEVLRALALVPRRDPRPEPSRGHAARSEEKDLRHHKRFGRDWTDL